MNTVETRKPIEVIEVKLHVARGKSARMVHEIDDTTAKLENLANRICVAQYDDGVSMDALMAMESEFDRLTARANSIAAALIQEVNPL